MTVTVYIKKQAKDGITTITGNAHHKKEHMNNNETIKHGHINSSRTKLKTTTSVTTYNESTHKGKEMYTVSSTSSVTPNHKKAKRKPWVQQFVVN
jgi:hypothetical protein